MVNRKVREQKGREERDEEEDVEREKVQRHREKGKRESYRDTKEEGYLLNTSTHLALFN